MTGQERIPREVVFVLLPKFSMIALYGALEPLRVANRFAGPVFTWRFISIDGEPVAASNEIPVSVSGPLSAVGRPSLAIFCASYEPERHFTRQVFAKIRALARTGIPLGGVDTGQFLLAQAGLLDGYRVALHWESLPGFRESYPQTDATTIVMADDDGPSPPKSSLDVTDGVRVVVPLSSRTTYVSPTAEGVALANTSPERVSSDEVEVTITIHITQSNTLRPIGSC